PSLPSRAGSPLAARCRSPIRRCAACRAISSVAWRAVVSVSHEYLENGLSSKPAMDSSYGTLMPSECAAASTPAAISSLEPKIALRAGTMLAPAPQEADALVAELDQVLGDRVGSVAIVHVDAGIAVLGVLARRDDAHERNLRLAQPADQFRLFRHRRGQHQSGQVRATHQRTQLVGQPRRG